MYTLLTNSALIEKTFSQYKLADAIRVKRNINTLSQAICVHLNTQPELINYDELVYQDSSQQAPPERFKDLKYCSQAVLISHLKPLFLDQQQLFQCFEFFDENQSKNILLRLQQSLTSLKQPSVHLLGLMQGDNINEDEHNYNTKAYSSTESQLDRSKQKLAQALLPKYTRKNNTFQELS